MNYPKYAYQLTWEVDHFENAKLDWDYDIEIETYEDYSSLDGQNIEPFEHPTPILYKGELAVVKHLDYPYPDNGWLVMSKKMLSVLKSVGDFSHREIEVIIMQHWGWKKEDEWYEPSGKLKKAWMNQDYVLVQLTEYTDVFDWDKSVYTVDVKYPQDPDVEEYVFNVPKNGLPPVFKIKEDPIPTFISAKAREALKEARITGIAYIPLNGYHESSEGISDLVDVPVKIAGEWFKDRLPEYTIGL